MSAAALSVAALSVDAFVLAGGQSRRMGRDKALIELAGRPLLERVIDAVRPVARRVVLVANDGARYARFGLPIVADRWPGAAALGGIGTALTHVETERAIVLACDLPFVSRDLLAYLADVDAAADVVLPVTAAAGMHPLCAIYGRRCLEPIARKVEAGRLKVAGFFPEVRVREVDEAELGAAGFGPELLRNLNTPDDLAGAVDADAC